MVYHMTQNKHIIISILFVAIIGTQTACVVTLGSDSTKSTTTESLSTTAAPETAVSSSQTANGDSAWDSLSFYEIYGYLNMDTTIISNGISSKIVGIEIIDMDGLFGQEFVKIDFEIINTTEEEIEFQGIWFSSPSLFGNNGKRIKEYAMESLVRSHGMSSYRPIDYIVEHLSDFDGIWLHAEEPYGEGLCILIPNEPQKIYSIYHDYHGDGKYTFVFTKPLPRVYPKPQEWRNYAIAVTLPDDCFS